MKPTPRTDAEAWCSGHGGDDRDVVFADFARSLERENAELKEMLGELTDGKRVILPKTIEHAAAMRRMGEFVINNLTVNPAGSPAEKE